MNVVKNNMNYVHRQVKIVDDKSFVVDIKYSILNDMVIEFFHIGIHAVLEDSQLSPCINKNPDTITEGMYADAYQILIEDGVIKPIL